MKSILAGMDIFAGVLSETMEELVRAGSVLEADKGVILIHARQEAPGVFFQLSGKSIVYNLTHSGQRKILFIFGRGALLNERILNHHTSGVFCEAFEKSRIFKVPSAEFVTLMEKDIVLAKNILETQEKKLWRLSHQLKNTTGGIYLEKKLASKLWKLARDFGIPTARGIEIDMNMPISFLADMLGVSRETTSRACSVLIDYGLIMVEKKRITIVNSEKMSAFYKTGNIQ
ncbi:MAG: Crp/Fnr family transcriptional regulator [Lachnospiraceae bacterium]|nr:Crp/Fnr family transcriptional regulator [Lachnospiraceae bacterium]MDY4095295.1 Crp/Fnr family transcriptional regulator [Lachnospiraceae bacterium]